MTRRRRADEQELPFVALMDTMTNVVGVLTIVLVMIGISLARTVSRVFSTLPPATEEQIRETQAAVDQLLAAQSAALAQHKEPVRTVVPPLELSTIDTELARLEKSIKDRGIKLFDVEALGHERAAREAELQQKKAALEQMLAERDRLKALLDTTPVYRPPEAKTVRIPVSRPIPNGARIQRVMVTREGVNWVDIDGAKHALLNELKSSIARSLESSRIKRGKDTAIVYDYEKLKSYFARRKLANSQFQMEVHFPGDTASPVLKLIPKSALAPAALKALFRRFKANPQNVVMFHVTGDGFEHYLAAREECDRIGVPAGWEAGGTDYQLAVYEIATNRPRKPSIPAPPQPNEIKRPSAKLD